jgi:hypothetical protein
MTVWTQVIDKKHWKKESEQIDNPKIDIFCTCLLV